LSRPSMSQPFSAKPLLIIARSGDSRTQRRNAGTSRSPVAEALGCCQNDTRMHWRRP
jgi:hypothetical protein